VVGEYRPPTSGITAAHGIAVPRLLFVLCLLAACSKHTESKVYLFNGFDFPVVVTIGETKLELAPHSRTRPAVNGKAMVKVTTKQGALISESEANFPTGPKGCPYFYNIMGAAAYVQEDVVYGSGFGTPHVERGAGEISDSKCGIDYLFRDPPDSISVNQYGPHGDNRRWLHYDGDGTWITAVNTLLDDTGQWASQSHGAAQRIVRAVVTHDPNNPALPAIAERLANMQLAMPEATPGNLLASARHKAKQ